MSELRSEPHGTSVLIALRGVGVWTPGYADVAAWSRRHVPGAMPDPQVESPRAELLPPMLRRRTSLLTRMAAEVAQQAMTAAGVDPHTVPILYGSVYGEIRTTVDILAAMLDPAAPMSPTRFHNSVHNTAAGYVSIATQNRSGNAALTAGEATLAMGLLECAGLVVQTGGPCVLVIAEETLPEPLAAGVVYAPLAAAFVVGPADGPGDRSRTCRLGQGDAVVARLPDSVRGNPCAPALALVDAFVAPGPRVVGLGGGWQLAIDVPGFPAVRELVPQRPPMLLLGAVIAQTHDSLTCTTTVAADWLLIDGDGLPAAALLEVMAQAVAALHGLQGRVRGEPVRVGLLLGARDVSLHVPRVRVGTELVVRATQVFGMDAVAEFRCAVEAGGACLAEGTLHVVRGDLEAQPA